MVEYNCEGLQCGENYIGNTQNHLKKRIGTHFTETRKLILKVEASDSFARHFGNFYKRTILPTANENDQTSISGNKKYPLKDVLRSKTGLARL